MQRYILPVQAVPHFGKNTISNLQKKEFKIAKSFKNAFFYSKKDGYKGKRHYLRAMETILLTALPVFVCLFWGVQIAVELARRRTRPLAWLLVFMLTSSLLYGCHFLYFNRIAHLIPLSDTLYAAANLAVYPIFLLYIRSLTHRSHHGWVHWIALLPTILGGMAVACLYLVMSDKETALFVESFLYNGLITQPSSTSQLQVYAHLACKIVFVLQIIPVFVIGSRYIRHFDDEVTSAYSDTEGRTLRAMHVLLVIFAITSFASFVSALVGRRHFAESPWLLFIPSLLYSTLLFAIGYIGCRQQFSIADIEQDEEVLSASTSFETCSSSVATRQGSNMFDFALAAPSVRKNDEDETDVEANEVEGLTGTSPVEMTEAISPVPSSQTPDLRKRIERVMCDEQLFLNPSLKLNDLVLRVGSNRNYVYNAINRELGVSFNEYVNRKRVEYAAQLMEERRSLLLTEVGERSGFASATSFYRNFKLYKGCSPKEYQSRVARGIA